MADYESRDLATAARRAQEAMAGNDDRPNPAELAEDGVDSIIRDALDVVRREARRKAIAEVVAALQAQPGYLHRLGYRDAVDFLKREFVWTPTDHGYDEEAGW